MFNGLVKMSTYGRARGGKSSLDIVGTESRSPNARAPRRASRRQRRRRLLYILESALRRHLAGRASRLGRSRLVYSVIVPVICLCGILGNLVNLLVLAQNDPVASDSTVLAAADLVTCILLSFSGLARGVFWKRAGWMEYDVFVYIPLGSISSNVAVSAAVGVAVDRLVIVLGSARCRQPSLCTKAVARKLMSFCVGVIVLVNVPFFFIYTFDDNGIIVTRALSDTSMFATLNWTQLVLFALLPALLLLICNAIVIFTVRTNLKRRELLLKCRQTRRGNYFQDQSKLTIILIAIVFLFLVGEIPTHLASRRSAISILYGGDPRLVDKSVMATFRLIATVLSAISCSTNFVMYCLLNPKYFTNWKALLQKQDKSKNPSMRIATIKGTMEGKTMSTHTPRKF
ncbi:probable G-protein coupled receptor B0563.6 [Phymastichus coffea]|uniref:probable G-protein coupled receptor B0563.6 n=1 Tax=Phymastichus coffea TaxID=108790 RepID=UPI00273C6CB8|nr:probable G-protein coupled receptor B0563.6 [Phymastichus coffea]